MKKSEKTTESSTVTKNPARTVDGREKQLIALAVDLAEKQLREGTASSQVITHYLKLGSTTAKLEQEKTKRELELLTAKTENLKAIKRTEELYAEAIKAMRSYSGKSSEVEEFNE